MSEMVLGEAVIVKQEYNLFDNEVENEEGIFVRVDSTTNKSLVYFPQFKEWAEIEHLERVEEGVVPEKGDSTPKPSEPDAPDGNVSKQN